MEEVYVEKCYMNSLVTGMTLGEFATGEFTLSEVARKQWQADLAGGEVAARQLQQTEKALGRLGLTRLSAYYLQAYEKARADFR